jgi:pimeloyl-ACP methyl ester carboxylesterase
MDGAGRLGWRLGSALVALALLVACGAANESAAPGTGVPVEIKCEQPLPAEARQLHITVPVAQDSDPLWGPAPTSELYFTALLPERCPGESFPAIVQSHGLGGSRITELAADGTLYPEDPGLDAIDELAAALPYYDYVVLSVDQRGHGESQPQNGGGWARVNDPRYEVQDMRALLDWAWEHAGELQIQREEHSGIARDIKVGTLGYSYGGGYQLALAALDGRIDALVPVATWHNLFYSLLVDGVSKQSWVQTLCLFIVTPSDGATRGTIDTPLMRTLCNNAAIRDPLAFQIRTLDDLLATVSGEYQQPRPVAEAELMEFFDTHSPSYLRKQERAGQPWGFGESRARMRPVPTLLVQGNRDGLFNLTDAYWNLRYLREAGADARLLTMDSGHLSPALGQVDGSANCGALKGVQAILGWFDDKLKGRAPAPADELPPVCLSVQATPGAPASAELAVELPSLPIGNPAGAGTLPVRAEKIEISLAATDGLPRFVPLATVPGPGYVLGGIPSIGHSTVTPGALATHQAIAIFGVGVKRGPRTFLVDDQVTALLEGSTSSNRFVEEGDPILMPGIGEVLEAGDEIGLLFYEQHPQYAVVPSLTVLTTLLPVATLSYIAGRPFPNITSELLTPLAGVLSNPNPYTAVLEDVRLPVFQPGVYPGSRLTGLQ